MDTKNEEIPKFDADQLKGWEEYRSSIYDQQTKSHDSFEKAMTFITSGALVLTLTFHDKIVPVENVQAIFLIALGWFFLAMTLFLNLVSHYLSSKSLNKSADEIDKVITYKLSFKKFNSNLEIRNKRINLYNEITIWLLGIGLIAIILYVILNIYHGKAIQSQTEFQTTKSSKTENEQSKSERTVDTTTYISIK